MRHDDHEWRVAIGCESLRPVRDGDDLQVGSNWTRPAPTRGERIEAAGHRVLAEDDYTEPEQLDLPPMTAGERLVAWLIVAVLIASAIAAIVYAVDEHDQPKRPATTCAARPCT